MGSADFNYNQYAKPVRNLLIAELLPSLTNDPYGLNVQGTFKIVNKAVNPGGPFGTMWRA
ncbi:hypothetical protein [Clostridium sp. DJ247]|uniref:hypothetical protein n=1 Tax=Clostridium sp. DJ247 TaxID=2726188 RepID=UPI0016256173|nr:hypothetical protein [Clostridium sp. DJ247]MBC2581122.1 hypothetical protein [Clostridium sp. DJ247]